MLIQFLHRDAEIPFLAMLTKQDDPKLQGGLPARGDLLTLSRGHGLVEVLSREWNLVGEEWSVRFRVAPVPTPTKMQQKAG